jgi:hypothetical protein
LSGSNPKFPAQVNVYIVLFFYFQAFIISLATPKSTTTHLEECCWTDEQALRFLGTSSRQQHEQLQLIF